MAVDVWRKEAEAQFDRLRNVILPALAVKVGEPRNTFDATLDEGRDLYVGALHKKLLAGWEPKQGYATDIGLPDEEEGREVLARAVALWREAGGGATVEGLGLGF